MKVIWNLTRLCSWNCVICCVSAIHVSKKQKRQILSNMIDLGRELSLGDKKKIVDELSYNNVSSIDFSGGDILLNEQDLEVVKYAATKFNREQLSISIPGTGLKEQLVHSIKDSVAKLEFTLDSIVNDIDGSRPYGYVDSAKRAISMCNQENIDVCVSTVLKQSNCSIKNMKDIYLFLKDNNVKEWEILRYYQVGRAADIFALIPDDEELQDVIIYLDELKEESVIDISFQHSMENKIRNRINCNALSRSIGILPDGKVVSCAWGIGYDGEPADDKFIIGYLPQQKLADILSSDRAKEWHNRKMEGGITICQVEKHMMRNSML